MAWDKAVPTNSGLLINAPAQIRANWDAIELGTDSSLQITNAKVSSTAAIVESKLLFNASGHGHTGSTDGKQISLTAGVFNQLPVANGGTGAATAGAATTALLPSQTGNSGKALITDGATYSLGYPSSLTIASQAQGDVLYHNGTSWTRLAAGDSGKFLKTQGAGANPAWDTPGGMELYTADDTFTAPAGITTVFISASAGGGGGYGTGTSPGGTGGGAGEYRFRYPVTVVPGNNYTVTIGAGGTGGAPTGGNGGNTVFGSITLTGGTGSTGSGAAAGGGSITSLDASGNTPGGGLTKGGNGGSTGPGAGGGTPFGLGGTGVNAGAGNPGTGFGAGGGGGNTAGGAGASGFCAVEW